MDERPWLTVTEVRAVLRAAGYDDSAATIRRDVDRGRYGDEGEHWYRTDSGYRMVRPAAVEQVIARRRQPRTD